QDLVPTLAAIGALVDRGRIIVALIAVVTTLIDVIWIAGVYRQCIDNTIAPQAFEAPACPAIDTLEHAAGPACVNNVGVSGIYRQRNDYGADRAGCPPACTTIGALEHTAVISP